MYDTINKKWYIKMKTKKTICSQYSSLIGQLIRKLNVLNKEQKICYGLTPPQCYTIETLGQKCNQTMKELSQDMGVTVSTMTRVVDVLVRINIVTRKENPADRREVRIELTEKGKDLNLKLKDCSKNYSKEILNHIPQQKRKTILESLKLLNDAVETVKKQCCR